MPRFYFHLHNDMVVCDDEGQDRPDVAAAQEAALKNAKAMAAASILESSKLNLDHRIKVADESGSVLFELPFRDVVKVEGL